MSARPGFLGGVYVCCRIKCTFLIEEQKIIVKALRAEAQSQEAKFKRNEAFLSNF